MDKDEFFKRRMSKSDASSVLRMNGEDVENFREELIYTDAAESDFMKSIDLARRRLCTSALDLGAEYVSSIGPEVSFIWNERGHIIYSGMALIRKRKD